jgi:hypothetical protein
MWEGACITHECTVTDVVVFEDCAILIHHAITIDSDSGAQAAVTFVGHGAGILVVAVGHVVFEDASACFIAIVIGARVVVITIHW